MMKLLIALLFFVNVSYLSAEDDEWAITNFHVAGPDFKQQRDCGQLMEFCHINMAQCVKWATKEHTFPTEAMRPEITIGPTKHGAKTLACVDFEKFENIGATPSGLVIQDATGQVEAVKFASSNFDKFLTFMSRKKESAVFVIKALKPMKRHLKDFCAHFEKVSLTKALTWMEHTQLGKFDLPWYVVPGAKHKRAPQIYEDLNTCEDGGKIYSADTNTVIQCSKIVCGGKEVQESSKMKKMSVIAQCQDEYHFAVAYITATKACLSKYPDEFDKAGGVTLEQALGGQGHSESEIKIIIDGLHPATRALHFWGDADMAVRLDPEYKDFLSRKWLNYEMRDNDQHQPTPRMFQHLMGAEKDMMQSIRKCSLDTQDKAKNCENKAVLPWDVYQVMMLEKEQRGANPEMSNETLSAEPVKPEEPETKDAANFSYPIWTVIVSFLVMMLGGLYMFII